MGEAIIARRGGTSGYKPKIYVQTAQPAGKNGEFWVQDSGYTLDSIVANTVTPPTLGKNALHLQISTSLSKYNWVVEKSLDVTSCILYGQAYYGGWRGSNVYIFSDGWKGISKNGNRLYYTATGTGIGELDPISYAVIASENSVTTKLSSPAVGGMKNRLFLSSKGHSSANSLAVEIDVSTRTLIRDIPNLYSIGGISNRLYALDASRYLLEIDPGSFSIINRVPPISYPNMTDVRNIDGTGSRLFVAIYRGASSGIPGILLEIDPNTLSITRASPDMGSLTYPWVGGLSERLISMGSHYSTGRSYVYTFDINTLAITSTAQLTSSYIIGGTK